MHYMPVIYSECVFEELHHIITFISPMFKQPNLPVLPSPLPT
jgi:hypothetical protein